MSPLQPWKRRRLDNAAHTLSQPFKSPFKTPLKARPESKTNASATSSPSIKDEISVEKSLASSAPPQSRPTPTITPANRPIGPSRNPPSAELLGLQKRHTYLLNQLSAARASLEVSNQALKIESSDRDTELKALIIKWRAASRIAAEDVFARTRDNVNKMGGVGAMRDRERHRTETAWGWDDEPRKADGERESNDVAEEDGESFRVAEDEGEDQDEREERIRKVDDYSADGDGYTMDMMLNTLNIDLDIIGYDKVLQKWVD